MNSYDVTYVMPGRKPVTEQIDADDIGSAVTGFVEALQSGGWNDNTVAMITDVVLVKDYEDNGAEYTLISSREFWHSLRDTPIYTDNMNWRDAEESARNHFQCNTEVNSVGWPQQVICCHTHKLIFP